MRSTEQRWRSAGKDTATGRWRFRRGIERSCTDEFVTRNKGGNCAPGCKSDAVVPDPVLCLHRKRNCAAVKHCHSKREKPITAAIRYQPAFDV
jgi:hypothetical protein